MKILTRCGPHLFFFMRLFEHECEQVNMRAFLSVHRARFNRLGEIFVHSIARRVIDTGVTFLEWTLEFVRYFGLGVGREGERGVYSY